MRNVRAGTQPDTGVQSVNKALQALVLLSTRPTVGVSELCSELGTAPSTAHRLLASLRTYDFVQQVPGSRRYCLGPAAFALAHSGRMSFLKLARPALERLCSDVNESVNLLILDGAEVALIDGVEAKNEIRVAIQVGSRIPAYATAAGKALLALLPNERIEELLPKNLHRLSKNTISDLDALMAEIEVTRARGWAAAVGESSEDVSSVAAAVTNKHGAPIAAVAITALRTRYKASRLAELAPHAIKAAQAIAADLNPE